MQEIKKSSVHHRSVATHYAATRMEKDEGHAVNSTSLESFRTPSHLRAGVFMRISQSMTNMFP